MAQTKNIRIVADQKVHEIVLREGPAINPKEKKFQILTGTIDSPRKYNDKRTVDVKKALVIIDDNNECSKITLICDQAGEINKDGRYCDTIIGKIETHPSLLALPINNSKPFSIDEFRTWIRQNAQVFSTFDEHAALTTNLSKVKMTIVSILEKEKDLKGNSKNSLNQTLNADLKQSFSVTIPILKGGPKQVFKVDICLQVEGNGIVIWLESNEMKKLIAGQVEAQIQNEKVYFEGKGFCVIYEAK